MRWRAVGFVAAAAIAVLSPGTQGSAGEGPAANGFERRPFAEEASRMYTSLRQHLLLNKLAGTDTYASPTESAMEPETVAFFCSAEARWLSGESKGAASAEWDRLSQLVRWLADNADLDRDGRPGWGLADAWDAFGDGSVNPANTPYTISTVFILQCFQDVLSVTGGEVPVSLQRQLSGLLRSVLLRWTTDAWTDIDAARGYFWYSTAPADAQFVPNVSAAFAATALRAIRERPSLFTAAERDRIGGAAVKAFRELAAATIFEYGAPFWPYIVDEKDAQRTLHNYLHAPNGPQDIVHHCYVAEAIRQYLRTFHSRRQAIDRPLPPWSINQLAAGVRRFWHRGDIYMYPQDGFEYTGAQASLAVFRPRIWGIGALLQVYAETLGDVAAPEIGRLLLTAQRDYGPWPNVYVYREDSGQPPVFAPRFAAHLLLGLASVVHPLDPYQRAVPR